MHYALLINMNVDPVNFLAFPMPPSIVLVPRHSLNAKNGLKNTRRQRVFNNSIWFDSFHMCAY